MFNDTYGHDCGDDVLIWLAKSLKKHCTDNIAAYRYGGEEFAMLFSGESAEEVRAVAESILDGFRKHKFKFTDKTITFSVGIAEFAEGMTSAELFEKADKTLYKAKREGKNRVVIAE